MDEDSSFAHPGVAMCFLVLSPRPLHFCIHTSCQTRQACTPLFLPKGPQTLCRRKSSLVAIFLASFVVGRRSGVPLCAVPHHRTSLVVGASSLGCPVSVRREARWFRPSRRLPRPPVLPINATLLRPSRSSHPALPLLRGILSASVKSLRMATL